MPEFNQQIHSGGFADFGCSGQFADDLSSIVNVRFQ